MENEKVFFFMVLFIDFDFNVYILFQFILKNCIFLKYFVFKVRIISLCQVKFDVEVF